MTKVTGWDNGLSQDYDKGLGRWFANRLGARQQLRQDFEMTQVLIDRATLEQLVAALEKSVGAMQGLYGGWRCEQPLKLANASITQGRAALANAEPTGWQKIETAPKDRTMFVVRGFNVAVRKDYHYDTDPYCVWATGDGFKRWPHPFKPTHWMPLPAAPKDTP